MLLTRQMKTLTSWIPTSCPPLSVRTLVKLSRSHSTQSRDDTARTLRPDESSERDFTDASWPRSVATSWQEPAAKDK